MFVVMHHCWQRVGKQAYLTASCLNVQLLQACQLTSGCQGWWQWQAVRL